METNKEPRRYSAEKKIEKVTSGVVKTKKKTGMRKIADNLLSDDAESVKSYVIFDVLIPSVKKAISDIVTNGIDMLLYGETGHSKKISSSRTPYGRYYEECSSYRRIEPRRGYSYDDIVVATRGEAEDVLTSMDEIIELYGMVSVADLYEMVGISGRHTDNNYGWKNLGSASAVRTYDGYLLKLPKAMPLD